jgi:hypothetical protein
MALAAAAPAAAGRAVAGMGTENRHMVEFLATLRDQTIVVEHDMDAVFSLADAFRCWSTGASSPPARRPNRTNAEVRRLPREDL